MRRQYLVCFVVLLGLSSCEVNAPLSPAKLPPFWRAVSLPSWQAGADSSMDACLAITFFTSFYDSSVSYAWSAIAAFNDGDRPVRPTGVLVGGQSTEWNASEYTYEHWAATAFNPPLWVVTGYLGSNFENDTGYAPFIHLTGPTKDGDTISLHVPLSLQYAGYLGDSIRVSYEAIKDTGFVASSNGIWITAPDRGSLLIPADSLKHIPAGTTLILSILHDRFFSKRDTHGHKIGIYSQHETRLHFYTKP